MRPITKFRRSIEINVPKEKVWKALADFGNICHGHPAVDKSRVTSQQKEGVGATRHCDFNMMGASAEERIVEWNDGKNIKIEVYELKKMPGIKTTSMDLHIQEKNSNTLLTATMEYTMKNSFFDIMNSMMMKSMNSKLLDGILAGHKKYIETGEIVTGKTKLDLSQIIEAN